MGKSHCFMYLYFFEYGTFQVKILAAEYTNNKLMITRKNLSYSEKNFLNIEPNPDHNKSAVHPRRIDRDK